MGNTPAPNRRLVRSLLLTLSGGVALSFAAQASAQAQDAGTASEGAGDVGSGDATATGNVSNSDGRQGTDGGVVTSQNAGIANAGVGVADTGRNVAVGNSSGNIAAAEQTAAGGTSANVNSGSAGNTSDGSAAIRTGNATAVGNRSDTRLSQSSGLTGGVLVLLQDGTISNVGLGVATTGGNTATGNDSTNTAGLVQSALAPGGLAHNSGSATSASNGSAVINTGKAEAMGNESTSSLVQTAGAGDGDPSGRTRGRGRPALGLVLAPQTALVLNAGLAVADTGDNDAVGNESINNATLTQTDTVTVDGGALLGNALASSSGVAENDSDGEACVCTGNATASGNISDTKLIQDLDVSANGGAVVLVPMTGVVANLGAGVALTGANDAVGNSSENTATTTQTATIDIGLPVLGQQVASSSGDASNESDGTAKIGTGNATAIGNDSDTVMAQGATIDGDGSPVIATLFGTTTNAGVGIATTGHNDAIGNDSVNDATLTQTATGEGIVSNQGSARNSSDGTAIIGDPDCDDEVTPTTPPTTTTPPKAPTTSAPGLPRTGGPIEVEAAIGLMLLLAGFGLRRGAKSAFRA